MSDTTDNTSIRFDPDVKVMFRQALLREAPIEKSLHNEVEALFGDFANVLNEHVGHQCFKVEKYPYNPAVHNGLGFRVVDGSGVEFLKATDSDSNSVATYMMPMATEFKEQVCNCTAQIIETLIVYLMDKGLRDALSGYFKAEEDRA